MSPAQAKQERFAAVVMSIGSIFIAAMEWIDRPEPGEIVEAVPDWYLLFNQVLHGAILALLFFSLARLPKSMADRPGLRAPFTLMILVGIVAAAYVLGRDLGMV
jgi:hypothetical protein